jgi:flagellar protein FlbT
MGLKILLKPNERIIIGGAVMTNGNAKSAFLVENTVPILREKSILSEHHADSPCKRIYFVIQLMYIDEKKLTEYHTAYWNLVRDVLAAAPSTLGLIDQISEDIVSGKYYQALKLAKKLIEYEQEAIKHVRKSVRSIS